MLRDVSQGTGGDFPGALGSANGLDGGVAALFPIRVVSQLTGINPVTIRAWERRYGLVEPERTPGGHRLYSRANVEILRAASRLIQQGVSISHAARLLEDTVRQRDSRDRRLLAGFLDRLHALDGDGMSAVFEASLAGSTEQAIALLDQFPDVVGTLPQLEQQFLARWLEGQLAFRIYQRVAQSGEQSLLVCSPPGHAPQTWALAFALGMVGSGLRPVVLLGPATRDLADAAARLRCAAIVLGGARDDWPGLEPDALPAPAFLGESQSDLLPLGNTLGDARHVVTAHVRNGRSRA
jgi:MerR family transcriptional regulator, light-induced transcriptional regulator